MNLTISLKLGKCQDLLETIGAYTSALNFVSKTEFEETKKVSNPVMLQNKYYYQIREKFNLPSQAAVSVCRDVASKYKSKKPKQFIKFKGTHLNLVHNRNFNFLPDKSQAKITTVNGRKTYNLHMSDYHKNLLDKCIKVCDSTVSLRKTGELYLNLCIQIEEPVLKLEGNTMGVDLGLTKLATSFVNNGKTLVINGGAVKNHRNKFRKLRQKLQKKGTKSAKRLLKKLSGKENRYMKDTNFCAVKSILNFAKQNSVNTIGVEDLSGIRNVKLRKEQRREINSWAFYQFREFLTYKAKLEGIKVVVIDPRYTSQACSKCGYADKKNRKTQKQFKCLSCNFTQNADINAASNIELLTRLVRSNLLSRASVDKPNVSNVDVKGSFEQLRRSLGTSQLL